MRWYRRYDELIGTESDRRANVRLIYPVNGQEPVALGRSAQWYTGTSLCCLLRPTNCLRLAFIRLIEWRWFERLCFLVILANCAFLAAMGPRGTDELVDAKTAEEVELGFLSFFTFELVCRAIAMGFVCGPESYLRSGFNRLDLLVVVLGWLPFVSHLDVNGTAARALRTLRPLRTLAGHAGMRQQVNTLIHSLPKLANVMILIGFIMTIYGILGARLRPRRPTQGPRAPRHSPAHTIRGPTARVRRRPALPKHAAGPLLSARRHGADRPAGRHCPRPPARVAAAPMTTAS